MAPRRVTPAGQKIAECRPWPVMLVLPRAVDQLLASAVEEARAREGVQLFKKDLLSALIVLRAPETAEALSELFWEYAACTCFGDVPMLLEKVNVTVALPPPVTHRLDLLVASANDGSAARALRRDIVSALVTLRAPDTGADGYELYRRYLECSAEDARVADRPVEAVLSLERPKPGRRASA